MLCKSVCVKEGRCVSVTEYECLRSVGGGHEKTCVCMCVCLTRITWIGVTERSPSWELFSYVFVVATKLQ